MASTKMYTKNPHTSNPSSSSFFHQQQSASSTNQNIDEDTTLTQEMHVKMAKKIAQLTKVSKFKKKFFLIYYLQIRERKKKKQAPCLRQIIYIVQYKKKTFKNENCLCTVNFLNGCTRFIK